MASIQLLKARSTGSRSNNAPASFLNDSTEHESTNLAKRAHIAPTHASLSTISHAMKTSSSCPGMATPLTRSRMKLCSILALNPIRLIRSRAWTESRSVA